MHYRTRVRSGAAVVSAVAALSAFSTAALARAADLQTRHDFKIPAQPLDTALLAFSVQSRVQVLMWGGVQSDAHSQGASGQLPSEAALTSVLNSTGFSFQQVDDETVAIVKDATTAKTISDWHSTAGGKIRVAQAETAQLADASSEQLSEVLTTVTVTGTRIVRDGYEAPTPVTVVGNDQIQDAGKPNIADVLNQMPVFQGSATPSSTTVSNGGQAGGNNLNLRNLGSNRTLVLFDGRRYPPEFVTGIVDINLMPDALIKRVDVVTGGASAVYGSDALAGVVNFVLDTDFTGVKSLVQGGVTSHGDGKENKASLTYGTKFADGRGHFLIEADQANQDQVDGDARSWNMQGYSLIQNPLYTANNGQSQLITRRQVGLAAGYPGGIISGGPLKGTAFGPGGTPFMYDYGSLVSGSYNVGGDWASSSMMGAQSLIAGSNTDHLFVHGSFNLNDNIEVFAQYNHGKVHTEARCCYDYYLGNLTVHPDNPFMPASVAAQATGLGLQNIPFGTTLRDPAQGFGTVINRWNDVYVLGAKGGFGAFKTNWDWNVYAQRGVSTQSFWVPYQSNTANFMQAIDAVRAPDGSTVCRSSLTNPGNGCVPYNLFGTGVVSQAMIDYTQGGPSLRQTIGQDLLGGGISGEPFSTWAGPVSVAGSFEYRKDTIAGYNDPISDVRGWFSTQLTAFDASQHVIEGALETVVPLAKDVKWAKTLDLNAGVRATDYSTSGYVTTWKIGLSYQPVDDLRFRLTQSRDIRAPNLNDLFAAPQTNHNTIPDPFNGNASYPYFQVNLGNPDLKPEEADTTGIGFVYQPSWLPGFNTSVDYYRIDTEGAIATVTYAYTLDQCRAGVQLYCSNITRQADGTLDAITLRPQNQASLLAEGIDFEASYQTRLADIVSSWKGIMGFRLVATNTLELVTDSGIIGSPTKVLDAAGTGVTPRWGINGTLTYDLDPFRLSWTGRFITGGKISNTLYECNDDCPLAPGYQTVDKNSVPSYFISNLSLTYKFGIGPTNAEVFLAVDNLFDRDPPLYPSQIAGASYAVTTNSTLYQELGSVYRAGIRVKM
ncbi:MAG TPA: TonB-dependent receptor [Steroidobacteraceae bacterium]|jgi:outer membrane receptor protein involved in Fe transport